MIKIAKLRNGLFRYQCTECKWRRDLERGDLRTACPRCMAKAKHNSFPIGAWLRHGLNLIGINEPRYLKLKALIRKRTGIPLAPTCNCKGREEGLNMAGRTLARAGGRLLAGVGRLRSKLRRRQRKEQFSSAPKIGSERVKRKHDCPAAGKPVYVLPGKACPHCGEEFWAVETTGAK